MKLLWIIGQSDTGKSTLARAIQKEYPNTIVIDDSFRRPLPFKWNTHKGLIALAEFGKHLIKQGFNVIIVAGAPYEQWRRGYYAMTGNLDWNVGRLLRAIDKMGLAEDTVVVFTSDHGEMFGAHGRSAKNIFYDEAAKKRCFIQFE